MRYALPRALERRQIQSGGDIADGLRRLILLLPSRLLYFTPLRFSVYDDSRFAPEREPLIDGLLDTPCRFAARCLLPSPFHSCLMPPEAALPPDDCDDDIYFVITLSALLSSPRLLMLYALQQFFTGHFLSYIFMPSVLC